jgi:hypothetical protein
MGLIDSAVRTITCNGPECKHTVTFDRRLEKQTFDTPGNEWMKSIRIVQTVDARNLVYCSDACEAKGVETGSHNLPEPKRIVDGVANAAAIEAAAQAAKQAEAATAALKAGQPVTLS